MRIATHVVLLLLVVFLAWGCAGTPATTQLTCSPSDAPDGEPTAGEPNLLQTPSPKPDAEPNGVAQGEDARARIERVRHETLQKLRDQAQQDVKFIEAGRAGLLKLRENAKAEAAARYRQEMERAGRGDTTAVEREEAATRARYQMAVNVAEGEYAARCKVLDEVEAEWSRKRDAQEEQVEVTYREALAQAEERERNSADKTDRFSVRAIEISGNTLIPTGELLRDLPATYKDPSPSEKVRDPNKSQDRAAKEGDSTNSYDFSELQQIATPGTPGMRRPVSTRTMEGLTKYIVDCYRRREYAGVYVYVSSESFEGKEARLRDDTLRIHVIEAKVGQVNVHYLDFSAKERQEGEKHYLRESFIKDHSPAQAEGVVSRGELEEFTNLLNQNPDRHVQPIISGSDEPNHIDVTYDVQEANPWHFYVQVDNAGTPERQWNPRVGLLNTNLTGNDDSLSLMAQVDVGEPTENYAAFGKYEFPFLTPRLRLGVYSGYGHFDINPETTIGPVNFLGFGSFVGTSLRYNLFQLDDWLFDLTGSLSWENSDLERDWGPGAAVEFGLYDLGFQFHRLDTRSRSSVSFDRQANFSGSDAEAFESARTGASPDFARYLLGADHFQYLTRTGDQAIKGGLRYIVSNARLVPAKLTAFGGLYTVRGYDEDELVADGGILATLEYRYEILRPDWGKEESRHDRRIEVPGSLGVWLVGFIDYGRAEIKDPVPGELIGAQDMLGVGPGLIFDLGKNFRAEVYNGWALLETKRGGDRSTITDVGSNSWYFSFMYRW